MLSAAAAKAPAVPEVTWLTRPEPPGLCISSVRSAGRIAAVDRAAWVATVEALAATKGDPEQLAAWWAAAC